MHITVCTVPECTWKDIDSHDQSGAFLHKKETEHNAFKRFKVPTVNLNKPQATVRFHELTWEIEEATRDSMVMDNHINRTQTIAVRLVLTRRVP